MINKTSLQLLEQLIMTLIFAFCGAICLAAFAKAHNISAQTEVKQQAVLLAANTAEALKGQKKAETVTLPPDYDRNIIIKQCYIDNLQVVEIEILYKGQEIYSLTTGWQEERA